MQAVLFLELGQRRLRSPRHDHYGRQIAAQEPPDRFVDIVVRLFDGDVQHRKEVVARNLCLMFLDVEVDPLALEVCEGLDVVSRKHVKLGVVQLRYILHALFDVGVELGIPLLEEGEVILVDNAHVDALQEEDVFQVLQAPNAENRQDADPIRPEIVDDIAHIFSKASAGAGKPRDDNRHRNVVGLSLSDRRSAS